MKMMIVILVCTWVGCSQTPSQQWKNYGGEITQTVATPLASVVKERNISMSEEVFVEATIDEVCENKGCWIVVEDGGTALRVEFKDYGFFTPWGSEGKKVRLQGLLREKSVSKASAEHMAEEMKNPPFKKDEIKDQQQMLLFVGSAMSIEGGTDLSAEQKEIVEGKKEKEGHEHGDH